MFVFESSIMLVATSLTLSVTFLPKWFNLWRSERQRWFFQAIRSRTTNKAKVRPPNTPGTGTRMGTPGDRGLDYVDHMNHHSPPIPNHGTSHEISSTPKTRHTLSSRTHPPDANVAGVDAMSFSRFEVEALLDAALVDHNRLMEATFEELELCRKRESDRKKELTRITDMIMRIRAELEFFRTVSREMSQDEIAIVFRARLAEFHLLPNQMGGRGGIGIESRSHINLSNGNGNENINMSVLGGTNGTAPLGTSLASSRAQSFPKATVPNKPRQHHQLQHQPPQHSSHSHHSQHPQPSHMIVVSPTPAISSPSLTHTTLSHLSSTDSNLHPSSSSTLPPPVKISSPPQTLSPPTDNIGGVIGDSSPSTLVIHQTDTSESLHHVRIHFDTEGICEEENDEEHEQSSRNNQPPTG